MQGSGTGFMGFGPTGFTTPIDTVLDRFGRTGTIFPSANHHVGMNGSVLGVPSNYGPGKNLKTKYQEIHCFGQAGTALHMDGGLDHFFQILYC